MKALRIVTPVRLHFGLLGWGPHAARQFGGFGLMVDEPGFRVSAHAHSHDEIIGHAHDREAIGVLRETIRARLKSFGFELPPMRLNVVGEIPPHHGLGSGTQRALALAEAAALLAGWTDTSLDDLAVLADRFPRSGVGSFGYRMGGLIVDGGHAQGLSSHRTLAELVRRADWPAQWHILMVLPHESPGPFGTREITAFRELPPPDRSSIRRVHESLESEFLPAAQESRFETAMASLEEIQRIVGQWFAPAQGGHVYGSAARDSIVDALRELGFRGLGQSSWGPTLFGFSDRTPIEIETVLAQRFGPVDARSTPFAWRLARANNTGRALLVDETHADAAPKRH
jgi:beta-RFAP synthase